MSGANRESSIGSDSRDRSTSAAKKNEPAFDGHLSMRPTGDDPVYFKVAREVNDLRSPADAVHGEHEHPYIPVFTPGSNRRKELDEVLSRYPTKMAALLPALWMVQHEHGWVSDDGMAEVAEVLDLTPAYVKGVVTFYTMYHQHPVGRHFIQVCTTSPCNACGAEAVVDAFLKHTGCQELGQTSPDGKYGVIEVECLGACGFATPVMINEDFIESVTPDKVPEILAGLE